VRLADGAGDAYREVQETCDLHRRAEQLTKELAARIFEHEKALAQIPHELKRPYRPRAVELIPQGVLVGKPIKCGGRLLF